MRFVLLSLIALFLTNFSYSQKRSKVQFAFPTLEELQAEKSAIDTTAEAEMLLDQEKIEFITLRRYFYAIKRTYHGRLKIYKKSGLDRGTIIINYRTLHDPEEIIEDIQACTFNLVSNEIVSTKLTAESKFTEKIDDYNAAIKLIAPKLIQGSIFEYSYTRITPIELSPAPPTWYFQGDIPFKKSEVSFVIPHLFNYKLLYKGYLPLDVDLKKDTTIEFNGSKVKGTKYQIAILNANSFKNEPYTSSYLDCVSHLEFEYASYFPPDGSPELRFSNTLEDINKTLLQDDDFGRKMLDVDFLNELAASYNTISDTIKKIEAAFRFIATSIKWNGEFGVRAHNKLKDVLKNRTGSSAEINLLLVGLLRKLSLDANPAIVSTVDHEAVSDTFPLLKQFNYTITHVKLGGEDILIDATDKFSKLNMLPYHSLCKKAFIIKKNGGKLIPYQTSEKKAEMNVINCTLDLDRQLFSATFLAYYGGYRAYELRRDIFSNNESEFIKKLKFDKNELEPKNIKIQNIDSLHKPLQVSYDFSSALEKLNQDTFYFNPLFNYKLQENPLKSDTRLYPIDFDTKMSSTTILNITLPEGLKILERPKTSIITLPNDGGKFSYIVEIEANLIKVKTQIEISKTHFSQDEYADLKEFYKLVLEKESQVVLLSRSKG